jgi:hypothetical protein
MKFPIAIARNLRWNDASNVKASPAGIVALWF